MTEAPLGTVKERSGTISRRAFQGAASFLIASGGKAWEGRLGVSTDLWGVWARENPAASHCSTKEALGPQGYKELGIWSGVCISLSSAVC